MPYIKNVDILSGESSVGESGNDLVIQGHATTRFKVKVVADIRFSATEIRLRLNYAVRVALYEIDDNFDVYSAFPNNHKLRIQHASVGAEDDYVAFSNAETLSARSGGASIQHIVSVNTSNERDRVFELRALVLCVPETATAMRWTSKKKVLQVG